MFLLCVSNNNKYNESNNFYYYDYLVLILYKLNLYHSDISVYLHLLNFTEPQIKNLKKIHPKIIFYIDHNKIPPENISGYISNLRVNTIKELFLIYQPTYIIYLDCDIIIRKSLNELIDLISKTDENSIIVSRRDNTTDLKTYFNTGVICIKNGCHIYNFLDYWKNYIIKNDYEWYSDQIGLYNSSIKFDNKIKILNLDKKYNDSPGICKIKRMFNHKSYIWHCQNEYNSDKWITEYYYQYFKIVLGQLKNKE